MTKQITQTFCFALKKLLLSGIRTDELVLQLMLVDPHNYLHFDGKKCEKLNDM